MMIEARIVLTHGAGMRSGVLEGGDPLRGKQKCDGETKLKIPRHAQRGPCPTGHGTHGVSLAVKPVCVEGGSLAFPRQG